MSRIIDNKKIRLTEDFKTMLAMKPMVPMTPMESEEKRNYYKISEPNKHIYKGNFKQNSGKYEEAIDEYKKAINYEKSNQYAYKPLIDILIKMYRIDETEVIYKKYLIQKKLSKWNYNLTGEWEEKWEKDIEDKKLLLKEVKNLIEKNSNE